MMGRKSKRKSGWAVTLVEGSVFCSRGCSGSNSGGSSAGLIVMVVVI